MSVQESARSLAGKGGKESLRSFRAIYLSSSSSVVVDDDWDSLKAG